MGFLRGCLLILVIIIGLIAGALYMGYSWFTTSGKASLCQTYESYQGNTMGLLPSIASCDGAMSASDQAKILTPRTDFDEIGLDLLEEAQEKAASRPARLASEKSAIYQFKFIDPKQQRLAQWGISLLAKSFTFTQTSYQDVFRNVSADFTQQGWLEFKKAVEDSQLLNFVTDSDLMLKSGLGASPAALIKPSPNSKTGFILGAPLVIGYGRNQLTQKQILWMTVEMEPSSEARSGWLITRFMARPLQQ